MTASTLQLRVDVALDDEADASELDDAARGLREELLDLDVEDVRPLTDGPPPEGARAIEVAIFGSLIVHAAQEVISAIVRRTESWAGRRSSRTVKLTLGDDTLELSGASGEDQQRLIEAFLARHSAEQP